MTNQRLQIVGFFVLLALCLLVILLMFLPFLKILAMAAILAILFLPVHRRILGKVKSETAAAAISIVVILLIVMVPLYIIGQLLFNEVFGLYQKYSESGMVFNWQELVHNLPQRLQPVAENLSQDLGQKLSGLTANAFAGFSNVVSNLASFVLSFFLVFFSVYYFLRDGSSFKKYINDVFPLSEQHENLLIKKLENAINGVVKGSFLVALTQGAVATIGFLIFGVPNPLLWGMVTILAALVPNVGTSLSLIPAVLYLLLTGHTGAGIGLAIWGALAVGTIDNIVSPRLVGSKAQLHPLLVLVSVLGGLQLFGVIGFLLGPIIAAVLVSLIDIYRTDLKTYMES